MMWTPMWGSGMWGLGLVWMVLFWGVLVAGIVWLVRSAVDRTATAGSPDPARRVLDERFARGEISVDEYEQRRLTLDARR